MKDTAESLQAQLRQVDDYERKGLLREEEAAAQRGALQRRLMAVVLPDTPAPRLGWRVRLRALGFMVVLVGSVTAYLLSGHAGLRRRSEEILDAGKAAAAQDAAARAERLARLRAGQPVAPDANGIFPESRPASGAAPDVAPLLAGRVELAPELAGRVAPEDVVFVVVRPPGDPAGLPLAALRKQVADLPFEFRIGERELVGAPARFMQAGTVVVSARVSKTGSGLAQPGDLIGTATASPWQRGRVIVIDRAVPAR
jgi:cytochrome c-type biogenesis protein CcmH